MSEAPTSARLVALADQCVQCGLCLNACPTYRLDGLETESPRGRIALARHWALGTIAPTPAADTHLDHCLGCRACEAVCPAGVRYGPLLIEARAAQRARRMPGWRQRAIEGLVARPRLLSSLMAIYRHLFPLLPGGLRPLPRPPAGPHPSPLPQAAEGEKRPRADLRTARSSLLPPEEKRESHPRTDIRTAGSALLPPAGEEPAPEVLLIGGAPQGRMRENPCEGGPAAGETVPLALFVGCVARSYEHDVRRALHRLCHAAGLPAPIEPDGQACCGALHAHAGAAKEAKALTMRNRSAFADAGTVLTVASGCHEAVAEGLRGTAEVVDAIAFLARRADRLAFLPTRARIALHLPCTQRNVVRSDAATRALLARVPGLDVVTLDAGFGCCGAAGPQMLADPARAAAFRAPLLEQLAATGATRLLSANLGCRLHFANAARVPVQHPLEFLAQCLP